MTTPAFASPQRQAVPAQLYSLADHEAQARELLDAATWAYYSGGAADEISLRANRAAWDALALLVAWRQKALSIPFLG